jgi:hypothetical protein
MLENIKIRNYSLLNSFLYNHVIIKKNNCIENPVNKILGEKKTNHKGLH